LGSAHIHFLDSKNDVDGMREQAWVIPISEGPGVPNWDEATEAPVVVADLEQSPNEGAQFAALPAGTSTAKNYTAWSKDFAGWLFRNQKLELFRSPSSKQTSKVGESERDFRIRLGDVGREQRDRAAEQLRKKYAPKLAALEDRIRRAEQMKEKQAQQARTQHVQT